MFWKLIRWGGTVLVVLAVLAATFVAGEPGDTATAVQPVEAEMPLNKNFNL